MRMSRPGARCAQRAYRGSIENGSRIAIGIVLYFTGAIIITIVRAKSYGHVPFPMLYMVPVIAAMALEYAA